MMERYNMGKRTGIAEYFSGLKEGIGISKKKIVKPFVLFYLFISAVAILSELFYG